MEEKKKLEEVIVNNEIVYLQKDILGWHTVFPYKNKDGSINWKNLISAGSWIKLFLVIVFVLIAIGAMFEVSHIVTVANECLNNSIQNKGVIWNLK